MNDLSSIYNFLIIKSDNSLERELAHIISTRDIALNILPTVTDTDNVFLDIEEKEPDIILLDLVLPKIDGLELLKQLSQRKIKSNPTIIVMSPYVNSVVQIECVKYGADYCLLEPINIEVLLERILMFLNYNNKSTTVQEYVQPQITNTQIVKSNSLEDSVAILSLEATKLLQDIGIPAHLKGYSYLKEAVILCCTQPELLQEAVKGLYPAVAEKYNTSPSRVERAIRHSIELTWNRLKTEQPQNFKYQISIEHKPNSTYLIAYLSEVINQKLLL